MLDRRALHFVVNIPGDTGHPLAAVEVFLLDAGKLQDHIVGITAVLLDQIRYQGLSASLVVDV